MWHLVLRASSLTSRPPILCFHGSKTHQTKVFPASFPVLLELFFLILSSKIFLLFAPCQHIQPGSIPNNSPNHHWVLYSTFSRQPFHKWLIFECWSVCDKLLYSHCVSIVVHKTSGTSSGAGDGGQIQPLLFIFSPGQCPLHNHSSAYQTCPWHTWLIFFHLILAC